MPSTLDTKGFELVQFPTKVKDFREDDEVISVYYKEVEEMLKQVTGATRVIVFDHNLRESKLTLTNDHTFGKKNTASSSLVRVHGDYSEFSGPERLRMLTKVRSATGVLVDPEEAAPLLKRRFSLINVWRNIEDTNV